MKTLRVSLISILMVFLLVGSAFAQCSREPLPEALAALGSDSEVTVTTITEPSWTGSPNDYHEFIPTGSTPSEALILYTGGAVDERAYAPMARDIAAAGYLVVLLSAPDCLALYEKERADFVITAHPEIEKWSIGGHSFGGVNACAYAKDRGGDYLNSGKIDGIVLWASYPGAQDDISLSGLKVVSIYGTLDGTTELVDIENSVPLLPEDTRFVALEGANHTQFGWYTDNATSPTAYDFLQTDDNLATLTRQEQQDLIVGYTVSFLDSLTADIPDALDFVIANEDGSVWEQVSLPGFDNETANISVVAMAEYQGRLYAMTRNQTEGAEVWRTNGAGWEQVLFPGDETNGVYGNTTLNNVWARMIVFQDKLYFGFSSGLQGNYLGSSGCEVWAYDGVVWEPVISDKKDVDEAGSITLIAGCAAADGNTLAQITDNTKSWDIDQWAGGTLQITSGDGENRKFNIISNTANTVTVQQDETAGTGADLASETEFTVCTEASYSNPYPKYSYTLGALIVGDTYEIGAGNDENGFGDYWNKTITDMVLFDDKLYVSTGLNYAHGAQIWYTEDGDSWTVTQAISSDAGGSLKNSYGNYHVDANYPDGLKAVSSSCTNMAVLDGVLYGGGTGTGGAEGSCSRMAKMTASGWELIVDYKVDANDTGTNENGFGDGMDCNMNTGNFMPWSIESFNDKLMVAINSLGGVRMLYSEYPSGDDTDPLGDATWKYSVGGDSALPPGFDDLASNPAWGYDNIAANLFEFNNEMYAGVVTMYIPEYDVTITHGAPIWKTSDGTTWSPITTDGLGDTDVIIAEAFTDFGGTLYVAASKGASSTPQGTGGAKVYRLAAECFDDDTCSEGSECVDGTCEVIPDYPPTIDAGPFLAAGPWPVLPTDPDSPMVVGDNNYSVLWTFSDDYASCSGDCTYVAEYQAVGDAGWIPLDVDAGLTGGSYAGFELPVETVLQNATTYALRFSVTDCASNPPTLSELYYFRVDGAPVLERGPFLAAGPWPLFKRSAETAFTLSGNYDVVWTFRDDYVSCENGLCSHRVKYRKVGTETWIRPTPVEGQSGDISYASFTLPVTSLENGTYEFNYTVLDCIGQKDLSHLYYFKVSNP